MNKPVKLDRYQLLGELGSGSFGVVYLAYDPKLEREVAVKLVKPEIADDPDVKLRFRREWKSISRLHHPNIIELLDYSDGEWMYLVTERLRGKTLLQVMKEREEPLSPVLAAALVHEVALALEHAHEQSIVHRDVKPENIFLEPNGRVVLCDFGIAFAASKDDDTSMRGRNTQLLGSPLYMSPEQVRGDNVGTQSDLFSLGSVAYYLVSKRDAFSEDSVLGVLKRIQSAEYHPFPKGLSATPYAAAVMQLLQADRAQRFASAEQVSDTFLSFLRESGDPRRLLKQQLASFAEVQTAPLTIAPPVPLAEVQGDSKTYITKLARAEQRTQVVAGLSQTSVSTAAMRQTAPPAKAQMSWVTLCVAAVFIFGLLAWWWMTSNDAPGTRLVVVEPVPPSAAAIELPPPTVAERPALLQPQKTAPPPREDAAPAVAAAKGKLRVIVQPWGSVYVDGVKMGELPVVEVELAAGSHLVRVVNPDYVPQQRTVTVNANEMAKLKVNLEEQ